MSPRAELVGDMDLQTLLVEGVIRVQRGGDLRVEDATYVGA